MKNQKTMLSKIEMFRNLVSEIDISKYDQKEFAEIVYLISIEVFNRKDITTLRELKSS